MVVSHPLKPQFLLTLQDGCIEAHKSLAELASRLRILSDAIYQFIRNEVQGEIILKYWSDGDTTKLLVWECEKLSRDEMRELARFLRQ